MKSGMKPSEIAAQCNVTSNSIRNWSKEFRIHLSKGANAPERYYTDRDATILRYISTLKLEGMKTHEIAERLAEMKFGDTESVETMTVPISAIAQQDAPVSPIQAPGPIVAQDYLMAIERRFETLERSRADWVNGFGFGFIAALLFVLVLIGLAVLYGGFR